MDGILQDLPELESRSYGDSGPFVVVLHGGPGAAGYMAPVAGRLAGSFRVLEPLQRGSGPNRLTVARHVADLNALLESRCRDTRPALVGHSWGAMLALAYGAAHPGRVGPLVLVGCGTFDRQARNRMRSIREERMDEDLKRRMDRLPEEFPDPDRRLEALGNLSLPLFSYDPDTSGQEAVRYDARGHHQSWADMVRLQEEGVYPAAFAAIDTPVLMLHGAVDPHPGRMIRASLVPHLPQLEYHEWECCGHYPWLERLVGEKFFEVLNRWLGGHVRG